jgi:hypothetical protein
VRDPDAPAGAEEYEVVEPGGVVRKRHRDGALGVGDRGLEILAQVRAEQRERAGREPCLHDGALVGEAQRDQVAGHLGRGRVRDRRDHRGERRFGLHPLDRSQGLVVVPLRVITIVRSMGRSIGSSVGVYASVTPSAQWSSARRAA